MNIKRLTIIAAATAALGAAAQTSSSPYSMFGYGILNDNATSAQRQMGGVGYATNSPHNINVMNPASYASIDSLTFLFDMGVDFTTIWRKENSATDKTYGGGLEYVTLQAPLSKRFGLSLGLLPFSSVGYSFGSSIDNGLQTRSGSGGFNQAYVGFSAKTFKGLSVGFNASYLFGTNLAETYAISSDAETSLFQRTIQVRDFRIQVGAQYTARFDNKSSATIGVVYSPKKTLLGHTWSTKEQVLADGSSGDIDTLAYISVRNNYELPHTFGVGLSYNYDNRLTAAVDFTYQKWADVKYTAIELSDVARFSDRWKIAAGMEYRPAIRGSWPKRVTYRAGVFYNKDYINIGGSQVKDYGAAFGFGFPTPGGRSMVNLGLEYRHRTAGSNYLRENFLNVTLGFKINEMWFWKSKIR